MNTIEMIDTVIDNEKVLCAGKLRSDRMRTVQNLV